MPSYGDYGGGTWNKRNRQPLTNAAHLILAVAAALHLVLAVRRYLVALAVLVR